MFTKLPPANPATRTAQASNVDATSGFHPLEKISNRGIFDMVVDNFEKTLVPPVAVAASKKTTIKSFHKWATNRYGKLDSKKATNQSEMTEQLYRLYLENYFMPSEVLQIMDDHHINVKGNTSTRPHCAQWRHWHQDRNCIPKCVRIAVFNESDQRSSDKRKHECKELATAQHSNKKGKE